MNWRRLFSRVGDREEVANGSLLLEYLGYFYENDGFLDFNRRERER
jgi:hypothetical protein